MERLGADLEFVGRPEVDPERDAPTPSILVAVGDITIFGGIIVGGDGRGAASSVGKGPVAAIVAAQHIDVIVRLFIAERRDDPEAVVEIIAEHRRAGRFPAADFAALAHLEIAGGREPVLKRSEEHTSELQSLMRISYAVFCLKKKTPINTMDIH